MKLYPLAKTAHRGNARKSVRIVLFIILWLCFGFINIGANLAYENAEYPSTYNHSTWSRRECRQEVGLSMFLGIPPGPIGTVILAAITGGFQDGLLYTCPAKENGE
jgi:hypothetical protein